MKKRIFALALCLVMALSLLPVPALAADDVDLWDVMDYLWNHQEEITVTNDTWEDELAQVVLDVLKSVMPDIDIQVTTSIIGRKDATSLEAGYISANVRFRTSSDNNNQYYKFPIPQITAVVSNDVDILAKDVDAITAAFADYFASAHVDESNILQQKNTLRLLARSVIQSGTTADWDDGEQLFSTSISQGYIRGTLLVVHGTQAQRLPLNVTIHADGSTTMGSGSADGEPAAQEPESAAVYLDDPRCVNITVKQAEKMYQDGERFVLLVCTSDCGWCNQMKKSIPSVLSAADYGIYAVLDDENALRFPWSFVTSNSLGTPYVVLVNGKNSAAVVDSVRSQEEMAAVIQMAKDKTIPSATGTTPAAPAIPATGTAYPSTQVVDLDGRKVEFQMYALKDANGNPTNYVKVRDLALALNGTKAQFSVDWNGAVNLVAGAAYKANGSENKTPFSGERGYTVPTSPTNVNGSASDLTAIFLVDDAGGGYTYYQLRDLGRKLGFNVDWSGEKGVFIETDKPYSGK